MSMPVLTFLLEPLLSHLEAKLSEKHGPNWLHLVLSSAMLSTYSQAFYKVDGDLT